jgi:hypothetical protein
LCLYTIKDATTNYVFTTFYTEASGQRNLSHIYTTSAAFDVRKRPWYSTPQISDVPTYVPPFMLATRNMLVAAIAESFSVTNATGANLTAVAAVTVPLTRISKFLELYIEPESNDVLFVTDADGMIMATTDGVPQAPDSCGQLFTTVAATDASATVARVYEELLLHLGPVRTWPESAKVQVRSTLTYAAKQPASMAGII